MMNAETRNEFDVADQIVAFKRKMAPKRDVLKRAYEDVRGSVSARRRQNPHRQRRRPPDRSGTRLCAISRPAR